MRPRNRFVIITLYFRTTYLYGEILVQIEFNYSLNSSFSLQRSWMSQISDDTKLSQLSIPGSHGSLTQESAKCQSDEMFCLTQKLTLGQQLGAGVRFIDLTIKQNDLSRRLFNESMEVGMCAKAGGAAIFGRMRCAMCR